jgi:hypothetical protein
MMPAVKIVAARSILHRQLSFYIITLAAESQGDLVLGEALNSR